MSDRQRPALFWVVLVLLCAEFLLVAGLTVLVVVDTLISPAASVASAVALDVLAVLASAWLGAIVVGMLRGQAWTRSSAIVWQVLQFAVGAGAVSGAVGQPEMGWPLVAVALVVFALLFTKPVVAATSRRDRAPML